MAAWSWRGCCNKLPPRAPRSTWRCYTFHLLGSLGLVKHGESTGMTQAGYVKHSDFEHGPVEIVDFPMKHGDFP